MIGTVRHVVLTDGVARAPLVVLLQRQLAKSIRTTNGFEQTRTISTSLPVIALVISCSPNSN